MPLHARLAPNSTRILRPRTTAVLVGLTAVACLAGCDNGSALRREPTTSPATANASHQQVTARSADTAPTPSLTSPTPATRTSVVTAAPATVPTSGGGELDSVLLTAADLGTPYTATASAAPQPLPCTPAAPPVDDRVHHVEARRVTFASASDGTEIAEQIYVYATHSDAIEHQHIDDTGLACSHGSIGGAPVDLAGPYNVAKQVNVALADSAQAWSLSSSEVTAELFLIRIRGVVVQFSFAAPTNTHPTVNALRVIRTGLSRIVQHG